MGDLPDGNGRILVAQSEIRNLSDRMGEFMIEVRSWMRETNERQLANGLEIVALRVQVKSLQDQIDNQEDRTEKEIMILRQKSERWDLINSLGTLAIAIIAYLNRAI